jgi:hypothetical protein
MWKFPKVDTITLTDIYRRAVMPGQVTRMSAVEFYLGRLVDPAFASDLPPIEGSALVLRARDELETANAHWFVVSAAVYDRLKKVTLTPSQPYKPEILHCIHPLLVAIEKAELVGEDQPAAEN